MWPMKRERVSEPTYFIILNRIFSVLKITFAQGADHPELLCNSIKTFLPEEKWINALFHILILVILMLPYKTLWQSTSLMLWLFKWNPLNTATDFYTWCSYCSKNSLKSEMLPRSCVNSIIFLINFGDTQITWAEYVYTWRYFRFCRLIRCRNVEDDKWNISEENLNTSIGNQPRMHFSCFS